MAQCTATSRGTGEQCKNPPVPGKTKCRFHGGKSLSGVAHPNFKTGKHSKDIPARLIARYEESLRDTELLNLQGELSLIDARIADVLSRVDTAEAGALWKQARQHMKTFEAAQKSKDTGAMADSLVGIREIIARGVSDYASWDEVLKLISLRQKLVDSEHKRLVAMQGMITTNQAMTLIAALVSIVRQEVTDRAALQRISTGISQLLTAGDIPVLSDN